MRREEELLVLNGQRPEMLLNIHSIGHSLPSPNKELQPMIFIVQDQINIERAFYILHVEGMM